MGFAQFNQQIKREKPPAKPEFRSEAQSGIHWIAQLSHLAEFQGMLVYGDPQFRCSTAAALQNLQRLLAQTTVHDLDSLRRLLIVCGQFEQGIADQLEPQNDATLIEQVQCVTDIAADLFCAEILSAPASRLISELKSALEKFPLHVGELTLKIPEGFEFYALYPEQFIFATFAWAEKHRNFDQRVLVVGVRSIGTTLSAVVAAVLRSRGWKVIRCTVRPQGHPFEREAHIAGKPVADLAIVADEGPGISGSSMAAVAEALVILGVPRERISFFPGHGNKPGSAASPRVCHWWNTTERFFLPLDSMHWKTGDLQKNLLQASALVGDKIYVRCEDLGGGAWREYAFQNETDWSPSFAPLERAKYKCTAEDGSAVLWKFAGFGAFNDYEAQGNSSISQYALLPIGKHHGFVASPWIQGSRLTREETSPDLIQHLANHVIESAHPSLSPGEHQLAIERLAEMTLWNIQQVLGKTCAEQALACLDAARQCDHLPRYGDGRLAPWEWIRTPAGEIVKTDWNGHDADHTLAGKQSLLWDIAGLLVEWNLSGADERKLLEELREGGIQIDPAALTFFRNAYSAFQMGKTILCESIVVDPAEKKRLSDAGDYYRKHLLVQLR